jgi:hypothetical protein
MVVTGEAVLKDGDDEKSGTRREEGTRYSKWVSKDESEENSRSSCYKFLLYSHDFL